MHSLPAPRLRGTAHRIYFRITVWPFALAKKTPIVNALQPREGRVAKSVLIVEDEPFILEALTFLLEREGLLVSNFSDGAGCVEHIHNANPDLVILDIMLPNVSGMKILEDLRADAKTTDLPILMLTAKGQKKDRTAAVQAGASLFMTKPFANDELVENVHKLLAG